MRRYLLLLGVSLAAPGMVSAQDRIELDEIEVSAPRIERSALDTPAAVTTVTDDQIREGRSAVQLEESLNRVPGFYFQNRYNFAQNQRISTRGFGARAPFGVRGIRIRVDGFPETLPDGQSQVDMIDLDSVARIEALRGPSSVLYGNATGGVLDITTRRGDEPRARPRIRAEAGSHGYRKVGLQGGDEQGDWVGHASSSLLRSDGYREQNAVRKSQFNAKATRSFDRGRELMAVLSGVQTPVAEDPGGLTAEEVAADREQADPDAQQLDAGQEVDQHRVGVSWTDPAVLPGELTARAFYTRRDFEQQLPFVFPGAENFVAFDRDFFGVGVEYDGSFELGSSPVDYIVGFDADRQIDDRTRHEVNAERVRVEQTVDERQQATAIGAFGQAQVGLTAALELTLGLRFDRIRFRIDDRLDEPTDFSGNREFTEPSQTASLGWSWREGQRVYATLGTAFETPTFTEFAERDGRGFNDDLDPAFAVNREIGARGEIGDRLDYELALFSVRVDDEITVSDDREDRDFFENAAETRREGAELGLEYAATQRLTLTGSWTYADYRFVEFTDFEGNRFDDNRLPGLPQNEVFIGADWRGDRYFAGIDARYVDEVFADNANDVRVSSYEVVDVRAGYGWQARTGERLDAWIGIDNVFAEEYFDNIRVNANSGRFFEPAPERIVRVGLEVGF